MFLYTLFILLASISHIGQAAKPAVPPALASCLKAAVRSLTLPTDAKYNAQRRQHNLLFDNYPLAMASPSDEAEMKEVLRCGRVHKLRVVPRNGGHSYEGNSVQNGAIILDLGLMNKVNVSPDKKTAYIQAGATLGEVYYNVWTKARKGFNGGTCPPVGVSGLLLGGGYGLYSRAHGMACDQVKSFKLMTWEGRVITVNATGKYQDLFWASCGGGGGNFGIVMSWSVGVFDVPSSGVQFGLLEYSPDVDTSARVLSYIQTWGYTANSKLGMAIKYRTKNPGVKIYLYYIGQGSLKALIQKESKLLTLGISQQQFTRMSWFDAVLEAAAWDLISPQDLLRNDWSDFRTARREKSVYIYKPMTKEFIKTLIKTRSKYPVASIQFHPGGGAIAQRASNATAFPHRQGTLGLFQILASVEQGPTEGQARRWLQEVEDFIVRQQGNHYAYINYIDNGIELWQRAYFRDNYERLKQVKSKYDPKNFFQFPQAIRAVNKTTCAYKPCLS